MKLIPYNSEKLSGVGFAARGICSRCKDAKAEWMTTSSRPRAFCEECKRRFHSSPQRNKTGMKVRNTTTGLIGIVTGFTEYRTPEGVVTPNQYTIVQWEKRESQCNPLYLQVIE